MSYDSPQAEKIRKAVKRAKLTAVIGLSERDGGSLYIAQWLIGPDGETIAKRRKLRPTHAERTVFGEGDGSDLAVHDRADVGRLGALCCWEHLQPLSKYAMYAQNEQVHVGAWPSFSLYDPFAHALGYEVNNAASKVYAVEGSCFFLGPCAVVSQAMIDELCDCPEKHAFLHAGGGHAVIYGPDGSSLAEKLPPDQEGILYADIDLGMIGVAKNAADPAGHYSRPDVTRLLLNTTRANRVEHFTLARRCRGHERNQASGLRRFNSDRSRPMESAIPEHLKPPARRHRRVPDDYAPPYPSFVARHKPSVTRVVMAYFGVQSRGAPSKAAEQALARIAVPFRTADGPTHWDRASYVDEAGFTNVVTVAYWDDRAKVRWLVSGRARRWTGEQRTNDGYGTFIEALYPSVEGYETLFSSLGTARRRRRARRRHERRGSGARLLGRHARPHPAVANQRDGAFRRCPRRSATARASGSSRMTISA